MDSIAHGVGAVASLELSTHFFPVLNTVFSNHFDSGRNITLEELGGFSIVLGLNLHKARSSGSTEFAHAELGNNKSALIDSIEDLSGVNVDIRLNKGERGLLVCSEMGASCNISIVNDLELSSEDSDNASEEEFIHAHIGTRHSLKEHLAGLQIVHLNCLVLRVECKEVLADEGSLLIVPLCLKNESLFS